MKNVYYEPSAFGLTQLAELEDPDACYSFDTLVFWLHKESGRVFMATDAGCSCPTPFEGYRFTSPDDNNLEEITSQNYATVAHEAIERMGSNRTPFYNEADRKEARGAVKAALTR